MWRTAETGPTSRTRSYGMFRHYQYRWFFINRCFTASRRQLTFIPHDQIPQSIQPVLRDEHRHRQLVLLELSLVPVKERKDLRLEFRQAERFGQGWVGPCHCFRGRSYRGRRRGGRGDRKSSRVPVRSGVADNDDLFGGHGEDPLDLGSSRMRRQPSPPNSCS